MQRLLICNDLFFPGGLGTYTLSMARELKERGWDIRFVAILGIDSYFKEAMSHIGSTFDMSSIPLGLRKIKFFRAEIESFAPDIILLNHCSLAHYLLPLIPPHVKPVAVLHNDIDSFYKVAALFNERIFRWIAPTQKLNSSFREHVPVTARERVRTVQHGVDEFRFNCRVSAELSRRIMFVGNIGNNKGADLLPEIFARIILRVPDAQFCVLGEGKLKASIQEECLLKNIPVDFAGGVAPDAVADYLSKADILLLPSRVEGFGLVIVEAMMCGVVPVVSHLEGITDTIIDNHETGVLVAVDDPEGFSSAIIGLLSNPDRLLSMKQLAQTAARKRFSLKRMMDDYESLFAQKDDRSLLPRRGFIRWHLEVLRAMVHKSPDGSYRFQQKAGTAKKILFRKLLRK